MIALRVRWPNADHPLLANPDIQLSTDTDTLTPVGMQTGAWDFVVPDGASELTLLARFSADLPAVGDDDAAQTRSFDLLTAVQTYAVEGDALTPTSAALLNPDGGAGSRAQHPLVQSVSAANALSGATLIELRTEFVDLTEQWLQNAPPAWNRALFTSDAEPDSAFVALAATGSNPPLWFAHFPKDLDPPSSDLGAMVFFRPHAHYTYKTAFETTHRSRGLADLNRYVLAPKGQAPFSYQGGSYDLPERNSLYTSYYPLRVGWQQAVLRSGKPIVAFHPWQTSGLNYGDALTARLPQRLEEMMRFLLGTARLGASHDALALGRLGVAGFSAGGNPAAECMKANRSRVREMFLFDPYKFADQIPYVASWARSTPDARLRMTGANFWGQMQTLRMTATAGLPPDAADDRVTLRPPSPTFFGPMDQGGGEYWNYVMQKHPEAIRAVPITHQFAMFGGDKIVVDVDGETLLGNVTWLEEFLSMSGF